MRLVGENGVCWTGG